MYKSEVEGKNGIVARVVAKSISPHGKVITTLECEYPRWIHGELKTHRLLSTNSASSRAIPVVTFLAQIRNTPALPIHWGKNQPGMSAEEELDVLVDGLHTPENWWKSAARSASYFAEQLQKAGYHKQVANRLTEPFQIMKTVITATEFDNFFKLRIHKDAQPEIQELAKCMKQAIEEAETEELQVGEWHTPYVEHERQGEELLYYIVDETTGFHLHLELPQAIRTSVACCAQVSYRKLNNSQEKVTDIYKRLIESDPPHSSPAEHCATPMMFMSGKTGRWSKGVSHIDNKGVMWSGNFQGWIQYRKTLDNEACWNYEV